MLAAVWSGSALHTPHGVGHMQHKFKAGCYDEARTAAAKSVKYRRYVIGAGASSSCRYLRRLICRLQCDVDPDLYLDSQPVRQHALKHPGTPSTMMCNRLKDCHVCTLTRSVSGSSPSNFRHAFMWSPTVRLGLRAEKWLPQCRHRSFTCVPHRSCHVGTRSAAAPGAALQHANTLSSYHSSLSAPSKRLPQA